MEQQVDTVQFQSAICEKRHEITDKKRKRTSSTTLSMEFLVANLFCFFFVFVFVLFHFLLSYYFRIYSAIARYLKLYKFVDKDISKHTQVEMGIETTHAKHK